ncbi:hypothetical protein [Amycolatopsis sp. CA-230715]|uniref:hypothetical protein n=1 Tax=Amycolatopsis sp. CA-230715 TaxID=2745196 RepID=UPI001C016967|nr:hypothetical protein [Amycolatopsis sp. CA-230715]QWF84277.1 hypothetical protein HUW46_07727 [Amycolatopsis sp. CA-230715]
MVGESHSGSRELTRRLLWNRSSGGYPYAPVVVLLGPSGSGKTHALKTISDDLGWGVVHAGFAFPEGGPVPAVEVLVRLVYGLSRKWRHRAKPQFVRFTSALIAAGAELEGKDREQDRARIRELIYEFGRRRSAADLQRLVSDLVRAGSAISFIPAPVGEVVTSLFPYVVRTVRPRLRRALRSLADFPQAGGGDPFDALVDLNRLLHGARPDVNTATAWLVDAFFADVRDNHRRMSATEPKSPCACHNPDNTKHVHNWVIMLDDVDHPGGVEFLSLLSDAREAYRRRHPDDPGPHDPLLFVTTSGRWRRQWEPAWRPPWSPERDVSRAVPACADASLTRWAEPQAEAARSPYYPVLLDPLTVKAIADVLGTDVADPKAEFVLQATGGLPAAVQQLAPRLREPAILPGARDLLGTDDRAGGPWYSRLEALRLADRLPGVEIDDVVTAAPFATAPWLIPLPARGPINQPHVGQILTELRTALWVIVPGSSVATADYVKLHPWVAANLVYALARRGDKPHASYLDQFTALRDAPDNDDLRRAYSRLALGDISSVAEFFEAAFDTWSHHDWVGRLTVVVHAPDHLSLDKGYQQLYEELVEQDISRKPGERGEIRNNVTRLLAAAWLSANPFAVRGQNQNTEMTRAFTALASASQLADVSALHDAAERAAQGRWP